MDEHIELRELTSSMQNSINLALVEQLRMLGLYGFKLDCHFLSRGHVGPQVDITEGTTPDLTTEPVLFPNSQLHTCDKCTGTMSF